MRYYLCYDSGLSGHSVAARAYARAMVHAGLDVEAKGYSPEQWQQIAPESFAADSTVIQCFIPPLMKPLPRVNNIAVPYHEWTRMPQPWVRQLDEFDDVWLSSRYLKDVLKNSGFKGNCTYLPVPIEVDGERIKKSWEVKPPFTFLSVGEWHFRKGFHLLMEAFKLAFPDAGDAELIIKTGPNVDYRPDHPAIRIISDRLSEVELAALYTGADAYITASLAEGLGLPVAEAMSFGLPVLAPTWSGLTEYCSKGRTYEIPFSVHPQPFCSKPEYFAPGQECAVISIEKCAELMRQVAGLSKQEREAVARKALDHLTSNFSLDEVAKLLKIHLSG